ncbi:MAG: PEGA domain-containing protein [Proteobacteria bacterium]|nr:PEGA domain-containing protein [Pseudomonadota bacterium]
MTTNSNVQPVMTSDPSIPAVSDPSIRAVKTNSKLIHVLLIFLVLVAVVAIGVSVFLLMNQVRQNEDNAARQKEAAAALKRINAQSYRSEDALVDDSESENTDDHFMFFSIYSTPTGADVYRNGVYIGITPIEQKRMLKSDDMADLLVVLDGYTIERRSFPMSENFSDAVTLEKKVTAVGAPVRRQDDADQAGDGVVANRAVVIGSADHDGAAKGSKGGKGGKSGKGGTKKTAVVDTGIVLPD